MIRFDPIGEFRKSIIAVLSKQTPLVKNPFFVRLCGVSGISFECVGSIVLVRDLDHLIGFGPGSGSGFGPGPGPGPRSEHSFDGNRRNCFEMGPYGSIGNPF